jgi:hypothetical protein
VVEDDQGAAVGRWLEGEADVGAAPRGRAADAVAGEELAGDRLATSAGGGDPGPGLAG